METLKDYLLQHRQDGILHLARQYFAEAATPQEKQEALEKTASMLSRLQAEFVREEYVKLICAETKVPQKSLKAVMKTAFDKTKQVDGAGEGGENERWKFPEGADKDEFWRYGFFGLVQGEKTGYYFQAGTGGGFEAKSNFIITPLFHKYDQDDNTRIIKIDNGVGVPEIVEMPSAALISVDQFRKFLFDKGPFFFHGNLIELNKINQRYLFQFPKAFELKTLGWQNERFFAWYNMSFNGKLEPYSEVGIVKHGDMHYFSPASSEIYAGFRQEDDLYENDRYLSYSPASINFEKWCELFASVYEEHAYAGIAFVFVSLFKDLVFKVDNNCPHLYCYGQSQSGKSKFAESITNLFFKELPAFNLNSGTDFAFANRLKRFRNCPVFLNEFDDQVVKDEWFQAIKGAYDGEGRERGKGGSKNKTETQRVNSALILVGQYLSTKDDNSVLSRSVMRVFHKKAERTKEQMADYMYLKKEEKRGLSGILTELLQHRAELEGLYYTRFNETMKALGEEIKRDGRQFNERVLRNYTALSTLYGYFGQKMKLPFTHAQFTAWAKREVVEMSSMISNNDILTDFWTTVETLFSEGVLREGEHYNIKERATVRVTEDRDDRVIDFKQPKDVLYLRTKNVQMLYARFKRSTGQGAIDLTSLTSYLKNRGYYIGFVNSEHFVKTVHLPSGNMEHTTIKTSAHLFDYEALGIALSRTKNYEQGPDKPAGAQPEPFKMEEDEKLPF
jgi:DNA primase